MGKTLIARGQATIHTQTDAYTLTQSLGEYVFPAAADGKITSAVTLTSTVKVTRGDADFTGFTIGAISKPAGFSSITTDNTKKTVTYMVAANTTTLAEHGKVDIPVLISGVTYHLSFVWSKAKAGSPGAAGKPGVDANLLDWVKDWNTGKTVINGNFLITPKLFAGKKNADGTLTGVAIGRFPLSTKTAAGTVTTETVDGIYGFKDGYKTFFIDNGGNVQLGRGNQFVKYNAATGKVEFGSEVSLLWKGATYIDKDGIFTGTLSATTVKAVKLDASQITSGTISAARIDVNALKASLVTAGNINALTLDVTKGRIGGWQIDNDSIFRGTKNNTAGAYTSASGSVTIGSNGIRGYKWRLDATGAGAVAGGNISWDAAGKVTFAASVSVAWTSSINSITTALGGSGYAKLTKIDAKGIYTGTVNASQITAGTISADRIASGSIKASKLDAASIKADIINTGYINGLSLTFTKGKIGGWTIGSGALTGTHIMLDSANKRVVVYGANSGATSGQRVQLYYSSDTSFGFYATDKNGTCIAQLGSSNQIAGWTISSAAIRKGNVQLGSDGSITNNAKWKLNNDGSGQIASGNISWNAAGKVTFSSAVSLLWKNDIEAAKTANYGYRYYKKIVINGESGKYYPVVFKGGEQTVQRDILIRRSYNEQAPTDWDNKSTTHKGGLILLIKTNFGNWGGIDYSWDIYELSETYSRMFAGAANCGNGCMFAVFLRGGGTTGAVYHLYSDQPIESSFMSPSPIPAAPQIAYNSDLIFQSGSTKANAPAPRTLTSAVEEEIRRHRFIKLAQGNDTTLKEHPLTYIGSTGIYTGTLTAGQVNAVNISASSIKSGTLSADRIAAGSINSSKLDAASIKANIINTGYINGLSLTFTKGKIGGWTIGGNSLTGNHIALDSANKRMVVYGASSGVASGQRVQIFYNSDTDFGLYATDKAGACVARLGSSNLIAGWDIGTSVIKKGNVQLGSDGSITNGTKWKLNNDGSGQIANGNISWNASGTLTFSSSVIEKWTDAANNGKLYARGTGLNHNANRLVYLNGKSIVNTAGRGLTLTVINRSNLSLVSTKNYDVYDNDTNCNSLASALNALGSDKIVVLTSYDAISINATLNTALQRCGGSNLTVNSSRNPYVLIGIPTIGKDNGLVSFYGTAASEPYAEVATAIVNGIPQGLNVTGKQKTYIDGNGVYTGTVRASQVIIDSTLTVGGSTYNGSISVKDAGNNVKVTLDRSGITAVGGRIGGWNIASTYMEASAPTSGRCIRMQNNGYVRNYNTSSNVDYWGLKTDGSAVFGTGKISFAADGSGYVANKNIKWDVNGNVTMTGTINANAGTIGGFSIGQGRIGSTATGGGSGGGLALYNDLFRVGNSSSYVLFGANTFPATSGGARSSGRVVNTVSNSYMNNYGIYVDVRYGRRNFGVWSNAAIMASACIGNKLKQVFFTGSGYTIDFSQANIFMVYANKNYNINLPTASSVASMFGYSSLPSDFAYIFTFVYRYGYGNTIYIQNVRNHNGGITSYGMAQGDSLTLLCANYPSFHYQVLNYSS